MERKAFLTNGTYAKKMCDVTKRLTTVAVGNFHRRKSGLASLLLKFFLTCTNLLVHAKSGSSAPPPPPNHHHHHHWPAAKARELFCIYVPFNVVFSRPIGVPIAVGPMAVRRDSDGKVLVVFRWTKICLGEAQALIVGPGACSPGEILEKWSQTLRFYAIWQ